MSGDQYDAPLLALRNQAGDLAVALAVWSHRDDSKPDARARRSASDAVDAIDAMLAGLYQVRAWLITEIRRSDDAAAGRADDLIARIGARLRSPGAGAEGTDVGPQALASRERL